MRLLFFSGEREWSGSARAFAAIATGLRERGHQVTFACRPDSPLETRLDVTAFEVIRLDPDGPWPLVAMRLRSALVRRFVEVVCVHAPREQLVAAAAARLAGRAALIRRVPHGERLSIRGGERFALRLAATGYVFASEREMREAPPRAITRIDPAVVPMGIADDGEPPRQPEEVTDVLPTTRTIVGLYNPNARLSAATLFRVVALLAPRHPELRLVLHGPGSRDEDLRMHAAALRIARRVTFLGDVPDVQAVIRTADLGWVLAGDDDGAYGLLDLSAARIPIIAERTALTEQYIADGITGFLLPPAEPADTASAVARLLAQHEERAAMGRAAHARVAREFRETAMVESFENAALAATDRSRW